MSDIKNDPSALFDFEKDKKAKDDDALRVIEEIDAIVKKDRSEKTEAAADASPSLTATADIDALLKSVGLSALGSKNEKIDSPAPAAEEKTRRIFEDEKTRAFTLKSGGEEPLPSAKKDNAAGQIFLDGYEEEIRGEDISQTMVELKLKKTRQNLIENFRVLSKGIDDEAILEKKPTASAGSRLADLLEPKKGEDFFAAIDNAESLKKGKTGLFRLGERNQKKRDWLKTAKKERLSLQEATQKEKKRLVVSLVFLPLSFVFYALFLSAVGSKAGFSSASSKLFLLLNLALFAAGAFYFKDILKDGIYSVIKFKPGQSFFIALSGAASLLQSLSLFVFEPPEETGYRLYFPFFFFSLFAAVLGECLHLDGVRHDLSVMMRSGSLSTLRAVENKTDAASLGYGISEKGEARILFSTDCENAKSADFSSPPNEKEEKLLFLVGTGVLAASAAFGVCAAILQKSASAFFTCFSGSVCLCSPVVSKLVSSVIKRRNDKFLSQSSVTVSSFESARRVAKCNAVVVDADEIFEGRVSKFRNIGSSMLLSDVVVFAAATLKNTKSVIRNEFDSFLEEEGIKLPQAEDVQYEDKLGYSCWIVGRRVLVGNREMLLSHSVPVPSEEQERAYAGNKSVLYVVVEGRTVGVFAVDYKVRSAAGKNIRAFNKTGIVLMLACGDPALTQETAAKKLMADVAAIKLATSRNSDLIDKYRASPTQSSGGLTCSKKDRNVLLLVLGAHSLFEAGRISRLVLLSGLGFCFVVSVLFAALRVSFAFSPVVPVLLQLAWGAISCAAGSKGLKY